MRGRTGDQGEGGRGGEGGGRINEREGVMEERRETGRKGGRDKIREGGRKRMKGRKREGNIVHTWSQKLTARAIAATPMLREVRALVGKKWTDKNTKSIDLKS